MSTNEYPFSFSPRLIRVLGEELVHDKKIAVAELVKNAYDADASEVTLTIAADTITIEDDGCGMNADIIEKHWLQPGNSKHIDKNGRTPKYKRLPIGEKGIGRLGVHKLGSKIKIISKTEDKNEIHFELDWDIFDKAKSVQEVPPVKIRLVDKPRIFNGEKTGTRLVISGLRDKFDEDDIARLYSDLTKILPPFPNIVKDNFSIHIRNDDGTLFAQEDELTVDDVIGRALFSYKVVIRKGEIEDFSYEFISPNPDMMPGNSVSLQDNREDVERVINKIRDQIEREKNNTTQNIDQVITRDIGSVVFQGYIFDAKFSRLMRQPHDRELNAYLKENGGIRVYRDGMRVYNYGEGGKDNDILNLDRKRAVKLGDNIGYNQLLATIELDKLASRGLIEKTDREGFIHGSAFFSLQRDLEFCMSLILYYRKLDRAKLKSMLDNNYSKVDIKTRIYDLVDQIDKLDVPNKNKEKINKDLVEVYDEIEHLKEVLVTASNTGLNMTIIVHELDKMVDTLDDRIKNNKIDEAKKVLVNLRQVINIYKKTIHLDKKEATAPVASIIKQAIFNLDYRFEKHGIKIIKDVNENLKIQCRQGLIIGTLVNIFDNAIYWLAFSETKNKKIHIKAYRDHDEVIVTVADNGSGFATIDFETALLPFVSGRVEDTSMGIGLYLAEQIMVAHQGSIEHGYVEEDGLPGKFANGAIIRLRFKNR